MVFFEQKHSPRLQVEKNKHVIFILVVALKKKKIYVQSPLLLPSLTTYINVYTKCNRVRSDVDFIVCLRSPWGLWASLKVPLGVKGSVGGTNTKTKNRIMSRLYDTEV